VQVAGAALRATMRIMTIVGDLVQRTRDGHTVRVLSGRMTEGWVAPCVVRAVHTSFLVEPQNQGRWFVSGLAAKPLG
jgi:hypothetical protein